MEMWWCFMPVEILMSFSSIWDVCVVVQHKMIVWQRSCQMKCDQHKSQGGVSKGWTTKQISNVVLVFHRQESWVFFRKKGWISISNRGTEVLLRNILMEVKIQSKGWFWWLIRGMMKSLKISKTTRKSFSKCVFWVDLYEGVVGLHFMKKYPDYRELQRTATINWCYRVDHVKEGCDFL